MKKICFVIVIGIISCRLNAQGKHNLQYWDFCDSVELVPKFRFFYTVLPVSEIMIPNGIFSIAQSTILDYSPSKVLKFNAEYRFQLLGLDYNNILRGGITVFPFSRVKKKEFPIQLKTTYHGYDGRNHYYSQNLTFAPINLLQKHGFNLMLGRYSMSSTLELKRGEVYVPDSSQYYDIRAYCNFGKRTFVSAGYKYERSRYYKYRSSEDRKNEEHYLKKVFTNSQVGFDIMKNLTKFNPKDMVVGYGNLSVYQDSPLPNQTDAYNFYAKRLNSIGFKLYWEKEISYWYQRNWGFRFGFEYFQGMSLAKGSGMMMMRFGAFGYL